MVAYATIAELEAFTGQPAPVDAQRLLNRASTTVAYHVRAWVRTDPTTGLPLEHVDTIRDAVCAQVEYWVATSEQVDIAQQHQASNTAQGARMEPETPLAPRAHRILANAGLRNPST